MSRIVSGQREPHDGSCGPFGRVSSGAAGAVLLPGLMPVARGDDVEDMKKALATMEKSAGRPTSSANLRIYNENDFFGDVAEAGFGEVHGMGLLENHSGSVYELVLAKGWLDKAQLDDLLSPEKMTKPRLLWESRPRVRPWFNNGIMAGTA